MSLYFIMSQFFNNFTKKQTKKMTFISQFLLYSSALSLFHHSCKGELCSTAFGCAETSITEASGSGNENIQCFGYGSCWKAISLTNAGEFGIQCHGSYSCYSATEIQRTSSGDEKHIFCYGLLSCAYANTISNINGDIYCGAALSCIGATIYVDDTDDSLYCYGIKSCAESTIHVSNIAALYGYLAAQDATLYSDVSGVTFRFWGKESGRDATVICGNGHTCYIDCYSDGCNDLTLICSGDCTFDITCDKYAELSDVCDDADDSNSVGRRVTDEFASELISFADDNVYEQYEFSLFENSFNICDSSNVANAVICDDSQECMSSGNVMSTNSNPGPVCCLSYSACDTVNNITSVIDLNDNSIKYLNRTAIRCDGYLSCEDVTDGIVATNGGNVCFVL